GNCGCVWTGEVEMRWRIRSRRRSDDAAVDAPIADELRDRAHRRLRDRVRIDEHSRESCDGAGDRERGMRGADGENHVATPCELVDRADVLESRVGGAAARFPSTV